MIFHSVRTLVLLFVLFGQQSAKSFSIPSRCAGSTKWVSIYNRGRSHLCMQDSSSSNTELREKLDSDDYSGAYSTLKRNPMMTIRKEDARALLNNLDKLVSNEEASSDADAYQKKMIETSTYVYKRCERQSVFRGFGSVQADAYPLSSMNEVSPQRLEELTGLNINALTPKQRSFYWQLAGISVCAAEYFIGTALGVDPLYTFIPGTLGLLAIDQLFYRGAYFETVYQTLFPEYKEKIIYHEAGHYLIAYLLGVPVRGCVTSAMEARKNPDIKGSAGTIFFDTKLADELDAQRVTRSSIDRLSVVIMAGIAAEALKYDRSEGGISDERSLTGFLTSVQPPWSINRIQGQARWAVSQAILLLREHQDSYDALVEVLKKGNAAGVGDAVLAIEAALPASLPSAARIAEKEGKRKRRESDALLRYVQRKTYMVGGIAPSSVDSSQVAGENFDESLKIATNAASSETGESSVTAGAEDTSQKLMEFTERIRLLETAVKRRDVDISKLTVGGLWLNDLRSLGDEAKASDDQPQVPLPGAERVNSRGIAMPPPLEGYEKAIEKLNEEEASKNPYAFVEMTVGANPDIKASSDSSMQDLPNSSEQLIQSHRGYQLKELENTALSIRQNVLEKKARLAKLRCESATSVQ